MSQRSIAQQISSVSITLIAGLLLLALFAVAATVLIRNTFVEYRATAKTTLFANAVFEDLFEARMAALKWRLTYTPEFEAEFIENIEEILIAEAELKESTGGAHGFDEVYEQLDTDLNAYLLEFEALQGLYQQYEAVEAELRTSGLAARQALSEIMSAAHANENSDAVFRAGQAQESLMLARYYLERFRRTEAPSDLDRSRNEASAAVQTLDILTNALSDPAVNAQVASVQQSLDEFISKTTVLSGTVTGQMTARETMDVLGPKMVSDVEMVIDRVVDRQNTLGPRGQSISFWAVVTLCIASVLIVGIGWRIARLYASRITQDINEAVTIMSRIAEGDLDAEVKGAENENEIGRMAQALEVFKAKGKEAKEATEREKAAEAKREQEERERRQQQKEKELAEQQRMEAARKAMISELSMSLGEVVSAASAGNFSKRVDADFSDQELVALADDVNRLVDSVDTGLCATVKVLERVGQGDLTRHMNGDFQGAFKTLQNNTNDMIDALKELIGGIGASSANLTASSSELRDTSDVLSKQAEQNAASLEETSAALEELTSSIKQVSQNVQEASENAQVARDTATSSSKVAGDAADAMSRISHASEEITQVVSVINDIAFQINLLALNAGVEAARAGDAGRGFSVVASEVRQLAQRASDSAKEINDVIGKSEQAVAEGVAKVTGARTSLEQISQSVVEVSARISEVSHAITEQVQGVGEVNVAVSQIDQNTQRQAASFEEVTAAGGLLSQEAQGLQQSIVRFDIGSKTEYASDPGPTMKKAAPQKPRVTVSSGNLAVAEDSWEEF